MSTVIFDTKLETEEITLVFDFISRLKPSEVILTCTVTLSVLSGTSTNPVIFEALPVNTTTQISVPISGGQAGVIYTFYAAARTDQGNVYVNTGNLAVLPVQTMPSI